jgi:molecular chaperone GrpE
MREDNTHKNENDIVFEENKEDSYDGEDTSVTDIKKLKEKLKKCLAEKEEYLDGWQRERASFANFKKDIAEEKKKITNFAYEQIISDILPVLDSFSMAFSNKDAWEKIDKNWRMGVEHIYTQLKGILAGYGVEEFSDEGKTFDPVRHHPQETVSTSKQEDDGKICEVIQKGYTIHGVVLRPVRVKVGEFKKE